MTDLPQTADCFACGKDHPNGLGLAFSKHGDTVRCQWEPRLDQTGFHNAVHGGLTATVLDEAMAWACGILAGRFAYSVEMTIRYHKLLTPGEGVACEAILDCAPSARLLKTKATLTSGENVIATAMGKYMPIKGFTADDVQREFGDGAAEILTYLECS